MIGYVNLEASVEEGLLLKNGFQFVRNDFEFTDWESKDGIWSKYIEELKDVVARAFGGESGGVNEIIAFHEGVSRAAISVTTDEVQTG